MKKVFLFLLLMLKMLVAHSQEIVVGDMNNDNELNITDVTTLVNTLIGKTPRRSIKVGGGGGADYTADNSQLYGIWRTLDGKIIKFNEDGTCSFGTGYSYKFLPSQGYLIIFTETGAFAKGYNVLDKGNDYLLLNAIGTEVGDFYFSSSQFISAIKLSSSTLALNTGQTAQLTATIEPASAKVPTLKWTSSKSSVASVDQTGKVTAKTGGNATITATATDGTGIKATCTVNVTQLVTSITFPYTTLTVSKGSTITFDATVSPSTANNKKLTWTSSNNTNFMCIDDGVFYAKTAGTYTVTATATDSSGKKATCKVTVIATAPTGISLSSTSLKIKQDDSAQLTATVSPSGASTATVIWTSSDPSVATVDKTGKVTAVANTGKATISATVAGSSSIIATCEVNINNHEYVDLGLPSGTLWATCNVGADLPEQYGYYFAWGETSTKSTFTWSNYSLCNGSSTTLKKYNSSSSYGIVDNKKTLELVDDAAYVNWGSDWRMPTKDDWNELYTKCSRVWTTVNGVNGWKVTATNGNYIFLPAAGMLGNGDNWKPGECGEYWTSTLSNNTTAYDCYFWSSSTSYGLDSSILRCYGGPVRPVRR